MSQVITAFWTRDSICLWVYRPKNPSSAPKCWGGLWKLHQDLKPTQNFSFLGFCSPRTTKCDFKVNVAFLNLYWDSCKTSLCKLCVKFYVYDGDFPEFQKNPEEKGMNVSRESTQVHPHRTRCSALHLHCSQLLTENRAHRLVWDTSSFYSSKIKFGCLVNMAFLRIWKILTR